VYGVEGQLLQEEDAAGGSVRHSYDPGGNLTETVDEAGAVTRWEYGPMGLCMAATDPLGNRYMYRYDSEMRLVTVIGPTDLHGRTPTIRSAGW
jgi:YD repeat-containing protein